MGSAPGPHHTPGRDAHLDTGVWETQRYCYAGEDLEAQRQCRTPEPEVDLYAWIAGQSRMVKALRRTLVTEIGLARAQVAFMGYWREGISMKS